MVSRASWAAPAALSICRRTDSTAEPVSIAAMAAGAGAVILKMLERAELRDHLVVVTRWYGGVHLGGDRFAHVVSCTRAYLEALEQK